MVRLSGGGGVDAKVASVTPWIPRSLAFFEKYCQYWILRILRSSILRYCGTAVFSADSKTSILREEIE